MLCVNGQPLAYNKNNNSAASKRPFSNKLKACVSYLTLKRKKKEKKKAHSIVLLLRCIDIAHQTGERVLRVNSKVMFH